ncbi:9530_t:CDS:2, partial [Acaulospora colombiana]
MINLMKYALSFAALAFFITPTVSDPCVNIVKKQTENKSYDDVKACFLSNPFNISIANNALMTLHELFEDFYIFTDQSKEPPENGFDFTPMDILKTLDTFLDNKNYTTDFEFNKDLRLTIKKLRDGHTDFLAGCYLNDVIFDQQIYLYSVVENGKQLIKVFDDTIDRSNVNCEVTQINSKPALQVITEFARTQLSTSRDLGVRFNDALVSLVRKWDITTSNFLNWNDTKTFQQFCSSTLFLTSPVEPKSALNSTYGKAKSVYSGAASAYTIGKDLGIIEVGTFSFKSVHSFLEIQYKEAFQELAKRKVKKVVIDFSNNPGGALVYSIFLSGLLIPSKHIAFPTDIRVPPIIQRAIQQESQSK